MTPDYANRISRARERAARQGIDGLLITPSADLLYLIGYDPPQLPRLTALVVRHGREPVLLVPTLEKLRAEASPAAGLLEITGWDDGHDPYSVIASLLEKEGRYGVSDRMWSSHLLALQSTLPSSEFRAASPIVSRLRARKEPDELELLQRAAAAADEAFSRISAEGIEGRTEDEVARSLATHLLDSGHESVAFTIVASGPNGASPHHEPGPRHVVAGDVVVMDFGGRVGGYCSDMTRTVSVGEPSREVGEVHEGVRAAQEKSFQADRPGSMAEEVDAGARTVIQEAGYGEAFIHRTGHGIGLDQHEDPYIVAGNGEALEEGMCFSIEPGIYVRGRFGVRIEDIVALTEQGAISLNRAPRDLAPIG